MTAQRTLLIQAEEVEVDLAVMGMEETALEEEGVWEEEMVEAGVHRPANRMFQCKS
jgi:hypothetical protein